MSSSLEYGLVGLAVLIAVGGIALAWMRLKPDTLVPKREAAPEEGFERVLLDKYYVDEIYDAGDRHSRSSACRAACSGAASTSG